MKKSKNYINKDDFYKALKEYHDEKKKGNEPVISNYIGECILQLCKNLATRPNFNGYSFKSEMIGDAVLNSIQAVDTFNPDETIYSEYKKENTHRNPFGYFTFIAWRAFLRRIKTEKKQNALKYKNFQQIHEDSISDEVCNKIIADFERSITPKT